MYIVILGRQPELGAAELESIYQNVNWFSDDSVRVKSDSFDFNRLGGAKKAGKIIREFNHSNWAEIYQYIIRNYNEKWQNHQGKITLGISTYGVKVSTKSITKLSLDLKSKLKRHNASLRSIPNQSQALSSATSHHNKLGLSANKIELLVISNGQKSILAESVGTQNITAYARRDQARPKRDAFVGMLPPKLAQIMINLASRNNEIKNKTLLDPFCGTGVVLQEAALMGYSVYGTDLSEKMVDYSQKNLDWLKTSHRIDFSSKVEPGDAMTHAWQKPIDIVAAETYLGQPFSAPPSSSKLREVRSLCNHIISTFLENLSPQLESGTRICIAVPAWSNGNSFTHLPLVNDEKIAKFTRIHLNTLKNNHLLYYREDQVVARELLIFEKS